MIPPDQYQDKLQERMREWDDSFCCQSYYFQYKQKELERHVEDELKKKFQEKKEKDEEFIMQQDLQERDMQLRESHAQEMEKVIVLAGHVTIL